MFIMFVDIIIIIIIWIMMARWAGDEIMNNPTIKSHIYMAPRPPCIIMMMRVIKMIKKTVFGGFLGSCHRTIQWMSLEPVQLG